MTDFKVFRSRLKSFLGKEENTQVHIDVSEATTVTPEFAKQGEMVREFADDPTPDSEIIDGIDEIYFSDMGFDASLYELQKLPETLDEHELDKYRNGLRRQLQAVSRELSKKILANQASYVRELDRVMDLESNLQKALRTCVSGRMQLKQSDGEIAVGGLEILAKNRRKVLLQKLLKSLRFIKTLQETDVRLKELLQETHYASAIQLCLECQQAAVTFHQYTCISELSSNLQEVLEQIEEQLDVALSKLCIIFDEKEYSKIQAAYKLLGKTQIAMDQLQMHFVSTISRVAVGTLTEVLEASNITPVDTQYQKLCEQIPLELFTPCLIQLCKNFWRIMYSYRLTCKWHEADINDGGKKNQDSPDNLAAIYDDNYIKGKLEQGLGRVWQDVQQKIKTFVLAANFGHFKYDEFIRILDVVNRLITIGEEFCNKKSDTLQSSLRQQTENYFKAYHKATLEELRMFLENEAWELCPVKSSFSIMNMQEFFFMKTAALSKSNSNPDLQSQEKKEAYFERSEYDSQQTPFDKTTSASDGDEANIYEDLYDDYDDDDDDDIPDELKRDFVDENTGEEIPRRTSRSRHRSDAMSENTPVVTNTTLNVLRSFGKYMQMMTVLKPIAFDVVVCMSQLFDYYLYSVYTFFAQKADGSFVPESSLNAKLRTCISRIYSNIILKETEEVEETLKVAVPSLSPMVDLSSPGSLYGLPRRLIGVESVVFLSKQLKTVHKTLDTWIPLNRRATLGQFFTQTVDTCSELRSPVYKTVAERVIQYDKIRQMMSFVKWDVKEIMSQHSPYIDSLVSEYQNLRNKLTEMASAVPMPKDSMSVLWSEIILLTNQVFVEGFSSVKRCSNEGRALMLLDFQQFLIKIDKITNVKPAPGREYVETYIKAFYLSESELETWLQEHQEYTPKQLNNLVTCGTGSHIGKKMKQKLTSILDDLQESKSRTLSP